MVIVGWKSAPCLLDCLRALRASVQEVDYEVVVSLNAPTKELRQGLRQSLSGATVVTSGVNSGFGGACNRGVAKSKGRFVVLLNDDARVEQGWLEALVKTAQEHPAAGAVGSRLLFPDGRLQEAGTVLWSDASATQIDYTVDPPDHIVDQVRRSDYCTGAALLVRRDRWDEVGGMDEDYFPAYYEDVDLCLKLASRGADVLYQPQAVVRHDIGGSAPHRYRYFLVLRNRARILARWPAFFAHQDPPPQAPDVAAVVRAAEAAAHRPLEGRAQPISELEAKSPGPRDYLSKEVDTLAAYSSELEDFVDQRDQTVGELTTQVVGLEQRLADAQGRLAQAEHAIGELREYLARANQQVEDLSIARAAVAAELEAIVNRRSLKMVEEVASAVRRIPGAERAVKTVAQHLG